jgi:hypothetical protein
MATIAIRMVVTAWPCARRIINPKAGIGAVGWITIIP